MLFSLLLAALPVASSTSSTVSAAANVGNSHVRLLDSGARVVFVDDESPDFPSIDQMTREQLQREYDRLDAERPGLGGAIGLLAGGAAVALVGLYVAIYGLGFAVASQVAGSTATISPAVGAVLLVVGLVMIAGGATLAIIGGLKLARTLRERGRYGTQMDRIKERIEGNPGNPNYAPPPPNDQGAPPPPPPPPPPSVEQMRFNSVELLTVASF